MCWHKWLNTYVSTLMLHITHHKSPITHHMFNIFKWLNTYVSTLWYVLNVTYHTSHMCRISRTTHHTSHVLNEHDSCFISRVTCHMSHITCDMWYSVSHITHHMRYACYVLSCFISHITCVEWYLIESWLCDLNHDSTHMCWHICMTWLINTHASYHLYEWCEAWVMLQHTI